MRLSGGGGDFECMPFPNLNETRPPPVNNDRSNNRKKMMMRSPELTQLVIYVFLNNLLFSGMFIERVTGERLTYYTCIPVYSSCFMLRDQSLFMAGGGGGGKSGGYEIFFDGQRVG